MAVYQMYPIMEIDRLCALNAELLALVKEARTDAINDLDSFFQVNTNSAGEYAHPDDEEIATLMQDFIKRLDAAIAKAEVDT